MSEYYHVEMDDEKDFKKELIEVDSSPNIPSENESLSSLEQEETTSVPVASKRKKKINFVWKDSFVELLIELWEDEPTLYDMKDPAYVMKEKRAKSIERIISEFEASGLRPVPSKEQLIEKMHSLRCYFTAQKNKVEASQDTDEIFIPKWQFYERLDFLNGYVTTQRKESAAAPARPIRKQTEKTTTTHIRATTELDHSDVLKESADALRTIAANSKAAQHDRKKTKDERFGETVVKEIEDIEEGYDKDLLKINIQKLIF